MNSLIRLAAQASRSAFEWTTAIERIWWRLWRGQVKRALDMIAETVVIVDATAENVSATATVARKVARLRGDLETYVSGQCTIIIDYATARRREEPISTAITEHGAMAASSANECRAANALVSARRSFDAESSDLRRERYVRPGFCHRGALGPLPVWRAA